MSAITLAAIKNRKITLLFTVAIALYGFVSYYLVPKQENPETAAPVALITTVYPGASPGDVEQLVTKRIEDAASEIDGFDHVDSYSRNSVSIVVAFLRIETDPEKSWQQLRQEIADIEGELPDLCRKPTIDTNLAETSGMIISLSGKDYGYDQLANFAEDFKKELSRIDGVARFDVDGVIDKEVKVEVEVDKLNQYAFSLEDLVNILRAQNVEIPSGSLSKDGVKIDVATPGIFESLRDIENTIVDVSPETGAIVRVADFAKVYMGLERSNYKIKQNGDNAVLLTGYFEPGENIVLVGKQVRQTLERVKKRFPQNLQIDEVLFHPSDVEKAVRGFMSSLVLGILLVIVVVFLGMGFRNAMIVSTAIPLSVLVTFIVMNLAGLQVQQISTAALIIALGMLVDNAIVIADAIQVRIDAGVENIKAAYQGARESAVPIFTATLTTVAAYSPLMFLPGPTGDFVVSIPLIVMISLSSSYVVAMVVTPTLAAMFFVKLKVKEQKEGRIRRFFYALLRAGLRKKKTTVAISLLALALALFVQSIMGLSFFPKADKDIAHIVINSEIPDIERTEKLAAEVEKIVRAQPEVTSCTTAIGEGLPKFFVTVPKYAQAEDFAHMLFQFDLTRSQRFRSKAELTLHLHELLQSKITGGKASVKLLELADPSAAPVVVRVSGADLDRIAEVSQQLQAKLREIPGTIDVGDDTASRSLEFRVQSDNDVANNMGISKYDIQRQINIALYGGKASVYRKAGNVYDIVVGSDITTVTELENLAIKSRMANHKILLKQFASVELFPRVSLIKRYQKEKSVTVTSFVRPGFSAPAIENTIDAQVLPQLDLDGVEISYDGEREKIIKNFGNIGMSALIAVMVVYLILLVQFNSFRQPVIILVTVPLSIIGSIVGLFIVQEALSFTAALGMASLVGIVVNNAILLIDFINKALARGHDVEAACFDAVSKRLRPIGLSTATTVMGLTPLMMSDNPLFFPMSISLMSGLVMSTLLTMVVIPVVFSLASGKRKLQSAK